MSTVKNKNKHIIFGTVFSVFMIFNFSLAHAGGISASKVIELMNQSRKESNLDSLSENDKLSRAAQLKAEDMIKNDYFSHISPQGKTPWHWFEKGGYDYKYAGENLAVNYDSSEEQHEAWMNSSSHRANILSADYREVGVAVVEGNIGGKRTILTVQLFGMPIKVLSGQQKDGSAFSDVALVPTVKSARSELVQSFGQSEGSLRAFGGVKNFFFLSVSSILLLGIVVHIFNTAKAKKQPQEIHALENGSQKIKVKYEDLFQIIKINVQNPKAVHSMGIRAG